MTAAPFDPADTEFVRDPYPASAALRELPGLARYDAGGMWLVARHAEVDAVFRDRRLGRVFQPKSPEDFYGPWNLVNVHSMRSSAVEEPSGAGDDRRRPPGSPQHSCLAVPPGG